MPPAGDGEPSAARARGVSVAARLGFDAREWSVLVPLSLVGFFEHYDLALLSIGAPPVYGGLGVSEEVFGVGVAVIRLGALFSVLVLRFADRSGRRRVLMLSIAAFTLTTGLTALAWSLLAFVVVQFVARAFLTAEGALASLVIAEEVRPDRRGRALSLLGVLAQTGYGVAALLLLVVPHTPLDWRLFYVAALGPLLFVAYLRRNVAETRAFDVAAAGDLVQSTGFLPHLEPRLQPRLRNALVVFCGYGLVETSAFYYSAGLAQNEYGWTRLYTVLLLLSGPFTLVGYLVGGRGSDRFGRRPIQLVGTASLCLGVVLVFSEVRALYAPGLCCMVLGVAAVSTLTFAYVAELFPTEVRATVSSLVIASRIAAGSVGLVIAAVAAEVVDTSVTVVALAGLAMAAQLALLRLPETAGGDVIGTAPASEP